jgi:hypothetical protein
MVDAMKRASNMGTRGKADSSAALRNDNKRVLRNDQY